VFLRGGALGEAKVFLRGGLQLREGLRKGMDCLRKEKEFLRGVVVLREEKAFLRERLLFSQKASLRDGTARLGGKLREEKAFLGGVRGVPRAGRRREQKNCVG
jgi:hypothetical protein